MTRAVATKAFIPQGSGPIINITASPHNGAAGFIATMAAPDAVENMGRTLATEWARYGVTVVAGEVSKSDDRRLGELEPSGANRGPC
jgi:NAD(P)-dependent dehydrogenase (short-subunit alcohol dehydrogenase family)